MKRPPAIKRSGESSFEEVGLGHRTAHFLVRFPEARSKVAVARSLINQPAVLLADEPTGALDSKNSEHLIDLLKKLNDEKGLTLLMVTHSVDSASQMKEAYRLDEGSLRQER